jgi:hypothetical protein
MVGPFPFAVSTRDPSLIIGSVTFLCEPEASDAPCPALVDWVPGAEHEVPVVILGAKNEHVVYPATPLPPKPEQLAQAEIARARGATVATVHFHVDCTGNHVVVSCEQANRLRRGDAIFAFPGERDPLWPRESPPWRREAVGQSVER